MNAKQLFAATFITLAGSAAMADDIGLDTTRFVSQKTRAEVRAEVAQAAAQGTLMVWGDAVPSLPVSTASLVQRAEVRAQVRAANARRELLPAGEVYMVSASVGATAKAH